MSPRIGSLCTGYGGLDSAAQEVFGGTVVWHSQYEPPDKNGREDKNQYAAQILAHHWPEIPNHGDLTAIDFSQVEPVDILTAGFPCQPFSLAGRRLGHQDERWLWDDVARAIHELRPRLVVLENVPGLFTAPGRQPDCVCGWNLRWGRQLGHLLHDHERPDSVLADDDRADDEAARSERSVGDAGWSPWAGGPTRPGPRLCGDAALGVVGQLHVVSADGHAPLPAGEEGPGEPDSGDAWPRLAGFNEWARDLLDPRGVGGVAEGEGSNPGAEPSGDGGDRRGDCPACGRSMDDPAGRFVRRAVGDVLGSLSRLGFDAQWIYLRASSVGAPHQRERVFLLAWPADADSLGRGSRPGQLGGLGPEGLVTESADAQGEGLPGARLLGPTAERGAAAADANRVGSERDRACSGRRHEPAAHDLAAADTDGKREAEEHPGAHVISGERSTNRRRAVESTRAAGSGGPGIGAHAGEPAADGSTAAIQQGSGGADVWGQFLPAVRRWEAVLGRPAPRATDDRSRLSPRFVEWMMGLPAGHVTAVPGLPRGAQLKALGNGVVPQQAAAAIRLLADRAGVTSR